MESFNYKNNLLYCEDVSLTEIALEFGTPCYVYSKSFLIGRCRAYADAFAGHKHLICYSVKASSNVNLLKIFADQGLGCDIVSGGELYRANLAGISGQKIVYSGVGKTAAEIRVALEHNILFFNVESESELLLINDIASQLGIVAPVALRVNPDVDPLTHPYISTGLRENKFGIPIADAEAIYCTVQSQLQHIKFVGVDCHIGSQLTNLSPFRDAALRVRDLVLRLRKQNIELDYIDVGGGLGVLYDDEDVPDVVQLADTLITVFGDLDLTLVLEPGRSIVANSAVLLTEVLYLKYNSDKRFAIVDAGMNDLLRPSLYDAYQKIIKVSDEELSGKPLFLYDVVGPICESGDFLAKSRNLLSLSQGDLLAVKSAGAYGFSMASNYNSRLRPVELLVDGDNLMIIRERECLEDLVKGETVGL